MTYQHMKIEIEILDNDMDLIVQIHSRVKITHGARAGSLLSGRSVTNSNATRTHAQAIAIAPPVNLDLDLDHTVESQCHFNDII